jgi:hypothetical protein
VEIQHGILLFFILICNKVEIYPNEPGKKQTFELHSKGLIPLQTACEWIVKATASISSSSTTSSLSSTQSSELEQLRQFKRLHESCTNPNRPAKSPSATKATRIHQTVGNNAANLKRRRPELSLLNPRQKLNPVKKPTFESSDEED